MPQVPQVPQDHFWTLCLCKGFSTVLRISTQDMLSQISQRVRHATGHAELQAGRQPFFLKCSSAKYEVVAELRRMESSMAALADKVAAKTGLRLRCLASGARCGVWKHC